MGAKQSLEFHPLLCGMQLTRLGAVTGSLLPPLPSCSMSQSGDGCSPELPRTGSKGAVLCPGSCSPRLWCGSQQGVGRRQRCGADPQQLGGHVSGLLLGVCVAAGAGEGLCFSFCWGGCLRVQGSKESGRGTGPVPSPTAVCLLLVEGTGRKQPHGCSSPLSGSLNSPSSSIVNVHILWAAHPGDAWRWGHAASSAALGRGASGGCVELGGIYWGGCPTAYLPAMANSLAWLPGKGCTVPEPSFVGLFLPFKELGEMLCWK